MEITESQLAFIREDIRNKGITLDSLAVNLVDHICCALESHPISDFSAAYSEVISRFGNEGIAEIELQTRLLLTIKKEAQMKKGMYLIGFIALQKGGFLRSGKHNDLRKRPNRVAFFLLIRIHERLFLNMQLIHNSYIVLFYRYLT